MLWNICSVLFLASVACEGLKEYTFRKRLEREGYKGVVEKSETFSEKLVSFFRDILKCLIPIVNIVAPFYFIIAYEKMYQEIKQ